MNKHNRSIAERFQAFCENQQNQGMLWYLVPLISLATVVMPISITAMSYFPGYIAFLGASILLYFTNIVLTIAEQPTKTKIYFYVFTVLFHIVIPLLMFILVGAAG